MSQRMPRRRVIEAGGHVSAAAFRSRTLVHTVLGTAVVVAAATPPVVALSLFHLLDLLPLLSTDYGTGSEHLLDVRFLQRNLCLPRLLNRRHNRRFIR